MSNYHHLKEKLLDVAFSIDNTGKEYTHIASPQRVVNNIIPISYKNGAMGIHQASRDTIPEEYVIKKKGSTYIRSDYLMLIILECIKKLDDRVDVLEKINKAPYKNT